MSKRRWARAACSFLVLATTLLTTTSVWGDSTTGRPVKHYDSPTRIVDGTPRTVTVSPEQEAALRAHVVRYRPDHPLLARNHKRPAGDGSARGRELSSTPGLESAPLQRPGFPDLYHSTAKGDEGPQRSLTSVLDEAGMLVDAGGDDVEVASTENTAPLLAITSGGEYLLAVRNVSSVAVYKSSDGGESWTLWSTFSDASGLLFGAAMTIGEGTNNRIFLAYTNTTGDDQVHVAYADFTVASPTWVVVTALANAGVDHGKFGRLSIDTDYENFTSYYVYVAALGDDGNGDDIWFARSTDRGGSYAPGYRVLDSATSSYDSFDSPYIAFGAGNYVHLGANADYTTTGTVTDVIHARALGWAGSGLASWEAPTVISAGTVSADHLLGSLGADTNFGTVVFAMTNFDGSPFRDWVSVSTNYGTAFGGLVESGLDNSPGKIVFSTSGDIVMAGVEVGEYWPPFNQVQLVRSTLAAPTTFTAPATYTRTIWDAGTLPRVYGLALDPTRGEQPAIAWTASVDPDYTVRFDAEWRRDPGYANTEVGFPLAVTGGGHTPPAIAEVDGDPEKEIVFATISGDVHVVNHDGTTVPGWPVNIGQIAFDTPVAVGDLIGNGNNTIAVGNGFGEVYAFNGDGAVLPGFPVQLDDTNFVHVSIGALGPPNRRYIVAMAGHDIKVLNYQGINMAPALGDFVNNAIGPAAIGDVDNDGEMEIVTSRNNWFHVLTRSGGVKSFRNVFGEQVTGPPALADLDSDGDLEIVIPSVDGSGSRMYVMNHDLTDYPGFPAVIASGASLTSASLANIISGGEPEIIFAERDGSGNVHMFRSDGTEPSWFPVNVGPSFIFTPPAIDIVHQFPSQIVTATRANVGYSYTNFGVDSPGWPRNLNGVIEETPAIGDIDNDGRNEVVMLGANELRVLDTGAAPHGSDVYSWRMFQNDAARTGCWNCEDVITAVGDAPSPRTDERLDVYPNPFNPTTNVSYQVAAEGKVRVALYDVKGRQVDVLVDGVVQPPGNYRVTYSPRLASGVYFLRMESASGAITRKIHLLK